MESLLARLADLQHWEIALLAAYLLFQGAFVAIFPEELIITTLGFLWSQNRIGFVEAVIAVWIGLLPANTTAVFFGNRFGPRLLRMRPFSWIFKKEGVEDSLALVRKHGKWIVFFTRFTPVIRGPVYLAAGLSRIPVLDFMKIDWLASCIQVPLLLWIGSVIGKSADSMMDGYKKIGLFMAGLLVVVIAIKMFVGRRRKARHSA